MDWFQWLSQTTLHPSLVYNYGVLFACNDLTLNDVAYFDHDFLLSMGVKIGKHRLEILKLAKAQTHSKNLNFMRLVATARRGLVRCVKKMSGGCKKKESEGLSFGKLSPLRVEWKEIREEGVDERAIVRSGKVGFDGSRFMRSPGLMADTGEKTAAKSGPIGLRKVTGPVLGPRRYTSGPINGGRPIKAQISRYSGPLDDRQSPRYSGPLNENVGFNKSPRYSGPLDEKLMCSKSPRLSGQLDECHSPWAMLFDDLKPT